MNQIIKSTTSANGFRKTYRSLIFKLQCIAHCGIDPLGINHRLNREKKDLEQALQYIEKHPDFLPAYTRACQLLLDLGQHYQAYALSSRGLSIKHSRRLNKTRELSRRILQQNNGFTTAAEKLLRESRPKGAVEAIRNALQEHPNDLKTLLVALRIYTELKKQKKSIAIAQTLREKHPHHPDSYSFLCCRAQKANNLSLAFNIAIEAAKKFPEDHNFRKHLNGVRQKYLSRSDTSQALLISQATFELYPKAEESYRHLCEDLITLEKYSEAITLADQFMAEFPANLSALTTLCHVTYRSRDNKRCLEHAEELIAIHPKETEGYEYKHNILKYQCEWNEALRTLATGLERTKNKSQLLRIASNIDLSSKFRKESIEIIEKIIAAKPLSDKYHNRKLRLLLSHGLTQVALYHANHLLAQKKNNSDFIFNDNAQGKQLDMFTKNLVKSENDPLCYHWRHSYQTFSSTKTSTPTFNHQPIQYWSQGVPPEEILEITEQWNKELSKIGLKKIALYDHASALKWISSHTPELEEAFKSAFHYAVEADIFRIAYALKNDCIWIDTDMVISQTTAATLAQRLESAGTTLIIMETKPYLSNCFFATKRASPFFTKIAKEMKYFSFRDQKPSRNLVLNTFGPMRYTNTLASLMENSVMPDDVSGHSYSPLKINDWNINFLNKGTFGRSKPEEGLAYFKTNDNWVNFVNSTNK